MFCFPPFKTRSCKMSKSFPFLRLPLELREQIYTYYFNPADRLEACEYFGGAGQYRFNFGLYRVNKQIHVEAKTVFRRQNVFVRIETPWPQAGMAPTFISLTHHVLEA